LEPPLKKRRKLDVEDTDTPRRAEKVIRKEETEIIYYNNKFKDLYFLLLGE